MDDLISRAAVLDVLVTSPNFHTTLTRIEELPAVDAVPVVRCKDCKHRFTGKPDLDCEICGGDDWYCADGERREAVKRE